MSWGPHYVDAKPPFNQNSASNTSLTTVNQAIYPTGWLPPLGGFFTWPGKLLHMRSFGSCTSGATPGNFGINFFWGNNTANNGTNLGGVSYTWTASQSTTMFEWELFVRCRVPGASGTIIAYGTVFIAGSGIIHFPYSSSPIVTGVDLTQNNYISPQVNRSGSTAETIAPYHLFTQALN